MLVYLSAGVSGAHRNKPTSHLMVAKINYACIRQQIVIALCEGSECAQAFFGGINTHRNYASNTPTTAFDFSSAAAAYTGDFT